MMMRSNDRLSGSRQTCHYRTEAFIMFREISGVALYVKRNRRQKPNEAYVLCALLCD